MGHGRRSDFTKMPQQEHDPGFVYDPLKPLSIETRVKNGSINNVRENTFGAAYNDKTMVPDTKDHYLGRGPPCDLGNHGQDL